MTNSPKNEAKRLTEKVVSGIFDDQPLSVAPALAVDQDSDGLFDVVKVLDEKIRRLDVTLPVNEARNEPTAKRRRLVR